MNKVILIFGINTYCIEVTSQELASLLARRKQKYLPQHNDLIKWIKSSPRNFYAYSTKL